MKSNEFLLQARKLILEDMLLTTNNIIGLNQTNFLSSGLFMQLPISINAEQTDLSHKGKKLTLTDLSKLVACHLDAELTVQFTFLYYNSKHLKHIMKALSKHLYYFSYLYLKQLQHLIRGHYTVEYNASLSKLCKPGQDSYSILTVAKDFAVNAAIKSMFTHSKQGSSWSELKSTILWSPKAYNDKLTEQQLVELIAEDAPVITLGQFSKSIKIINYNGTEVYLGKQLLNEESAPQVNLADRLYRSISEATWGKGDYAGSDSWDEALAASQIVDTKWITKLAGSFKRVVKNKTDNQYQSWSNLNATYRHIYNSPVMINEQTKLRIILSVDNSGSMESADLNKIYGIIQESGKYIAEIIVITHTTDVSGVFHLQHDDDISEHVKFHEALGIRHASGGTSHSKVFECIDNLITNPDEYVYFSFSDNYSDIESSINNYPIMGKLSKYWITPSNGRNIDLTVTGGQTVLVP